MANESGKNQTSDSGSGRKGSEKERRQKAAEARAAAQTAEKRRQRLVYGVGGLVVLAIVGLIVGLGVMGAKEKNAPIDPTKIALPTGSTEQQLGTPIGAGQGVQVELYEDFQCPACARFEGTAASVLYGLANSGKANLRINMMNFLDDNLSGSNVAAGNPQSSARAAAAFGCAVDAGKGLEYHNAIYANQPQNEGDGYSQDLLLSLGSQVGIQGDALTTFEKCVKDETYVKWPTAITDKANEVGVTGTPRVYVNGKEVPDTAVFDPAKLSDFITKASQQ